MRILVKTLPTEEQIRQRKRFMAWCEKKGYFPHTKYYEAWVAALEDDK